MEKKNWFIVGICGTTCSGKTTLAKKLKENLEDVEMLLQDCYFLPNNDPRHVRIENLNHNNWELITAVDMNKMYQDVMEILQRNDSDNTKNTKKILILEGFLLFNYKPLTDLCDLRYYIELTKDVCWERRQKRDYDPPDPPGYFHQVVWPEHEKHKAEILANTQLKDSIKFCNGSENKDKLFQQIFYEIKQKLNV